MLVVRFSADCVRFSPKSGRIDTVTVESARDPKPAWPRFSVCIASTPTPPSWALMLGLPIGSPRAGDLHTSTTRAQRDGGGLEVGVLAVSRHIGGSVTPSRKQNAADRFATIFLEPPTGAASQWIASA